MLSFDKFGQAFVNVDQLVELLYRKPELDLTKFLVVDPDQYNQSVDQLHADLSKLTEYIPPNNEHSVDAFDKQNQAVWHMPAEYQTLDIAQWLLDQCTEDFQLQRVGHELLLYQERDLFNLLKYLKYLVDCMRENSIVWGVGRGSSVSSYVLFLIGVHKIDSLYYDLAIEEFLR